MFSYFAKRILLFIPTLILVSLLVFGLSKMTPGDPVEIMLDRNEDLGLNSLKDYEIQYAAIAQELGLDKPPFYCTISPYAFLSSFHRKKTRAKYKTAQKKLLQQYGNWLQIKQYHQSTTELKKEVFKIKDALSSDKQKEYYEQLNELKDASNDLAASFIKQDIESNILNIKQIISSDSLLNAQLIYKLNLTEQKFQDVLQKKTPWKLFIPSIQWNGFDNQYHNWFCNFFGFNEKLGVKATFPFINWEPDWGRSYFEDKKPVANKIISALKWTLILNLISIPLIFLIAIPIGVYAAKYKFGRFDKISTFIMFLFFSLPTFWIATMLVVFFTTPEYGAWTDIFPSTGLGDSRETDSLMYRFLDTSSHLILPVFCLVYPSVAFVTRQMRTSMIEVQHADYTRTAKAKGLSSNVVLWKHNFKNALFPIITIFANILPSLIVGSIVIEVIFDIQGMGLLLFRSIMQGNWPIVYGILMLSAILSMIGFLLADFIYMKLDPRVNIADE